MVPPQSFRPARHANPAKLPSYPSKLNTFHQRSGFHSPVLTHEHKPTLQRPVLSSPAMALHHQRTPPTHPSPAGPYIGERVVPSRRWSLGYGKGAQSGLQERLALLQQCRGCAGQPLQLVGEGRWYRSTTPAGGGRGGGTGGRMKSRCRRVDDGARSERRDITYNIF